MIESMDELMMMVSGETQWTVHDMIGMEIIRFLKVVASVKRKMKARAEAQENSERMNRQKK